MTDVANKYGLGFKIGTNVATASPTVTTSADLVSAATNTNGIIVTSMTMAAYLIAGGGTRSYNLQAAVNGTSIGGILGSNTNNLSGAHQALGGFCYIEIPAAQAVGYVFTGNADGSNITITWKAK